MRFKQFIQEATAMSVAKQIWQHKKGKEDDISPEEIDSFLKKAKILTDKNYKEVEKFLKAKGFKVWKRFKPKYGRR